MKPGDVARLRAVLAEILGIPAESIGHVMAHAETEIGTMVVHSMPTKADYTALIRRLAEDDPLDMTQGRN